MFCYATRPLCLAVIIFVLSALAASAGIVILDATFHGDRMYPEYYYMWNGRWSFGDPPPTYYQGGAICVYVYNNGSGSVTISDLTINSESVNGAIGCGDTGKCGVEICSTYYGDDKLIAEGIPVWWRVDQNPVPPGGTAEIFVRMRRKVEGTLSLSVVAGGSVSTTLTIGPTEAPRISGYGILSDYRTLYLYLRHPVKGTVPTQILVDNVDVTSSCNIATSDSDYDLVPVRCYLGSALARGSYHTFQAVYSGGAKATVGIRVFNDDFKYCTWGGTGIDPEIHSVNLRQAVSYAYNLDGSQYSFFLCDEPDASEHNINTTTYGGYQVGLLTQGFSRLSQSHKTGNPQYPTHINMDGSFKPLNYYNYGHVTDILSVDPYYQTRILDSYWYSEMIKDKPIYAKATYIYAVAQACNAAQEPGLLQMVINSCRKQEKDPETGTFRVFRWATPEEKRIEVYYSLAAGAKSIAYWWMAEVSPTQDAFAGIGNADEPGSAGLWREMGLLGAEAGIASPVIMNSCPVDVKVTAPGKLWTRALLSGGLDTLVLICVNDDYACDEAGTVIQRIDNAEVSLDLPSWLSSPTNVFEVDYKGIHDVSNSVASGRINLHLGAVDVSRMIIITKDSALKTTLTSRYTSIYGPRVTQLIPLP